MQKTYIIYAYNGVEVIDNRPEAELYSSHREYMEKRYMNEEKRKREKKNKKTFQKILEEVYKTWKN